MRGAKRQIDPELLKRPEGWTDPRDTMMAVDGRNVPRYSTEDGLEVWVDIRNTIIKTNDPKIYFSFHAFNARDYEGCSYGIMHFSGGKVVVTQEAVVPMSIKFNANFRDRSESGA